MSKYSPGSLYMTHTHTHTIIHTVAQPLVYMNIYKTTHTQTLFHTHLCPQQVRHDAIKLPATGNFCSFNLDIIPRLLLVLFHDFTTIQTCAKCCCLRLRCIAAAKDDVSHTNTGQTQQVSNLVESSTSRLDL